MALIESLEATLEIRERWSESSPEYQTYHQENVLTNYRTALNELERLIVMRLSELIKISTSGTGFFICCSFVYSLTFFFSGYKLRRQITKALQRRSEAIRNAIKRYNTQAALLKPPRPLLTWKEVADYAFLGEFDLLRHSESNVLDHLWAQPARRAATVKYFKLQRAREEIECLNIEIRRLRTSIHDETIRTENVIASLKRSDPNLAQEIRHAWSLRSRVNGAHLKRFSQLEELRGFTGRGDIGVRLGSFPLLL